MESEARILEDPLLNVSWQLLYYTIKQKLSETLNPIFKDISEASKKSPGDPKQVRIVLLDFYNKAWQEIHAEQKARIERQ